MTVLRLVVTSNQDTIDAARFLLDGALRGTITGINASFRDPSGDEDSVTTGAYRAHPERAVMAALRLGIMVMKISGDLDPT